MEKPPLIILTGPTAVGKTEISTALAKAVNGEIISADSMQVYKHMNIGSAKIHPEEMAGIPHHMIDILEPTEDFNVVTFQQYAKKCIHQILSRGHVPILVGGTGFYIQSVLYDIDFTENEENTSYRQELEKLAFEKGNQYLHEKLASVDPKAAQDIHANNVRRIIRALEFYELTGTRISE
ncbi:MAG: tRNA (adenosine(37)-N6)-dimethylallyltransferase MiaA, partial [Clostridiales bacterium]|nr:tRNA (adenosine(37)-N6)-dimethylallyltransferase MiaA [Clostridiales bacterium]